METINYQFRETINKELGGFSYNYCYQCGACVADCPAHRFMPEFNPRLIVLQALLGMEETLTGENALIWNCTNCYNCYERCPQSVHPIEVIIALKNIARKKKTHPQAIEVMLNKVREKGVTVLQTSLIQKRRKELGLTDFKIKSVQEVSKLMQTDEQT